MDKVIELAREAGIDDWWESGNEVRGELNDLLTKFYTLARADLNDKVVSLEAENAKLKEALQRVCSHGTRTSQQIDADWDFARAVLGETKC